MLDCVIVGGGPAGLTAAIYLSRFHLSVAVVDAGRSRAKLIPQTHNHAGFPGGIGGTELLERMRRQARLYGTALIGAEVTDLCRVESHFAVRCADRDVAARAVLLATGVINRRPDMPDDFHADAVARGLIRYCPICDGYEVTDRRVAVIGSGDHAAREALFLRSYTADVSLISPDPKVRMSDENHAELAAAGIALFDGPVADFTAEDDAIAVTLPSGRALFQSIYPAMGSDVQSALATAIGATASEQGSVVVDSHQRTSVPGLYAAGDVVLGLDQISHAMGEGGVAAATIRNDLAKLRPLRR